MDNELYHDGQKGMGWHSHRWYYEDGSLTPEGKIHVKELRDKRNKLAGKAVRAENKYGDNIKKYELAAARNLKRSAKYRKKENGLFVSDRKRAKLEKKAQRYETRYADQRSNILIAKAKFDKLADKLNLLDKDINDLESGEAGKAFIEKRGLDKLAWRTREDYEREYLNNDLNNLSKDSDFYKSEDFKSLLKDPERATPVFSDFDGNVTYEVKDLNKDIYKWLDKNGKIQRDATTDEPYVNRSELEPVPKSDHPSVRKGRIMVDSMLKKR